MAQFGNTSETNTSGIATIADGLFLTLFPLTEDGYVSYLRVNISGNAQANNEICGLVYQDSPDTPGYPGMVMGRTIPVATPLGASPFYIILPFAQPLFLKAGNYWLGVTPGRDFEPHISYVADTSSSLIDSAYHGAFNNNPPDPMTSDLPLFADEYKILMYAEYTPVPMWNVPLKTTQKYLNDEAGVEGLTKQEALNILAGTDPNQGLSKQDAANIYAGTTGLSTAQALSSKAGTLDTVDIDTQEAARRL